MIGKLKAARIYGIKDEEDLIVFVYSFYNKRMSLYNCIVVKTLQTRLFYDIELFDLE